MPSEKLRTIVEEFSFEIQLDNLVKLKVPRVEEFVDGAKWLLARTPHEGKQIGSTDVWFLPNEYRRGSGELPIVLYYTFDDNFVNLLSIVETIYPPREE